MILHLKEELVKKVELFDDMKQQLVAESSRKQVLLEEQVRVLEMSQNHDGGNSSDILSLKLLRVNKLETEKLIEENTRLVSNLEAQNRRIEELVQEMTMNSEEKQKVENEFFGLCEKVKVKDESLLKSTQRLKELEDLLQVNKLEMKNLMEDNTRLVNNLEAQNRRIEELMKEKTGASMIFEEKQKLENGLSGLFERVKVKDESLLKSTQRAEELEELLRVSKLENKNLTDEKALLVNLVSNLEAQNQGLCEDIKKMTLHKDDLVIQMETATRQIEEYFHDVELTGMLENILQRC